MASVTSASMVARVAGLASGANAPSARRPVCLSARLGSPSQQAPKMTSLRQQATAGAFSSPVVHYMSHTHAAIQPRNERDPSSTFPFPPCQAEACGERRDFAAASFAWQLQPPAR